MTLSEKIYPGIIQKDRKLDSIFPFDSDRKMMSVLADNMILAK